MMALRSMVGGLLAMALAACEPSGMQTPGITATGDAQHGKFLLADYGCAACHRIKGIAPVTGFAGPPLSDIAKASYIAGILPNTEDSLVRWIMHPRKISPGTAMPELGVSEDQARDMAAYLYHQ
jgi:cytochrome c2